MIGRWRQVTLRADSSTHSPSPLFSPLMLPCFPSRFFSCRAYALTPPKYCMYRWILKEVAAALLSIAFLLLAHASTLVPTKYCIHRWLLKEISWVMKETLVKVMTRPWNILVSLSFPLPLFSSHFYAFSPTLSIFSFFVPSPSSSPLFIPQAFPITPNWKHLIGAYDVKKWNWAAKMRRV